MTASVISIDRPADTAPAPSPAPRHRSRRRQSMASSASLVWRYGVLLLSLAIAIVPMYVLLVTSLKPPGEVGVDTMWSLPKAWDTSAWGRAWAALSPSFGRTIVLAVASALISSVLGALNGYVLARVRFRGVDVLFGLVLFGMFIPYQAVMMPLRDVVTAIGLPPGIATLIFVHTVYGIPICTMIFRNYYINTIPMSLIESASMDGASVFVTFTRIVLPLSAPIFVVAIIWQFTMVWNDFLFAIFMTNTSNGPIMLTLSALAGAQSPDYAQSMAGALIASMPPLLVYIVLGRYFVSGLMAGAVKG